MSIGMQTPEAVHMQTGEQRRYWKNSRAMGYNEKKAYLTKCPGAAVPQHLDKTNQSNYSTVNQNSGSVKTFRDKKTPTVNPVSDMVNHISLTALKVST